MPKDGITASYWCSAGVSTQSTKALTPNSEP